MPVTGWDRPPPQYYSASESPCKLIKSCEKKGWLLYQSNHSTNIPVFATPGPWGMLQEGMCCGLVKLWLARLIQGENLYFGQESRYLFETSWLISKYQNQDTTEPFSAGKMQCQLIPVQFHLKISKIPKIISSLKPNTLFALDFQKGEHTAGHITSFYIDNQTNHIYFFDPNYGEFKVPTACFPDFFNALVRENRHPASGTITFSYLHYFNFSNILGLSITPAQ